MNILQYTYNTHNNSVCVIHPLWWLHDKAKAGTVCCSKQLVKRDVGVFHKQQKSTDILKLQNWNLVLQENH